MTSLLATCATLAASAWPGLLAWRPLLDPMPVERIWPLLLLPLAVAIAIVYKTIKLDDLARLPRQAAILSAQIIVFMIAAAAIIWVVVELA